MPSVYRDSTTAAAAMHTAPSKNATGCSCNFPRSSCAAFRRPAPAPSAAGENRSRSFAPRRSTLLHKKKQLRRSQLRFGKPLILSLLGQRPGTAPHPAQPSADAAEARLDIQREQVGVFFSVLPPAF